MNVSVLVCSFGTDAWRILAQRRAFASAQRQGAREVLAIHSPDMPLHAVRNAAAESAQGEWLCFLDADDELAPGYLQAMRDAASSYHAGHDFAAVLYPSVQYVYEGGRVSRPTLLGRDRPLIDLNRAVVGSLVPRELFLEVGGFGPEPIYEDWDLWLRCSRRVPLLPVASAVYRVFVRPRSRNLDRRFMREWYETIRSRYVSGAGEGDDPDAVALDAVDVEF